MAFNRLQEVMRLLFYILIIFILSCTKNILIEESDFNYHPLIKSVQMDSVHYLSENDTTFLRINVWIEELNGIDDIDEVIYYIKREDFFLGTPLDNLTCDYEDINDLQMITSPEFKLINSSCYGGYDLELGKVCEELVFDECQNSNDCSLVDSEDFLFYTYQSFKPSNYPYCGGFGNVNFQFQVIDSIGLSDLSDEIHLQIEPVEP